MVIGHATYLDIKTPFGSIYYATLMQENGVDTSLFYKLANALTGFIYSFHMPLFFIRNCEIFLPFFNLLKNITFWCQSTQENVYGTNKQCCSH